MDLQIDLRLAAEHLLLNPRSIENARLVRERLTAAGKALPTGGDAEEADELPGPASPMPLGSGHRAFLISGAVALRGHIGCD